jgi:tRNA (mo5U34)-methyltransferase
MGGPTQEEVDRIYWWHPFTFPNGAKARGAKGEEICRMEAQCAFKYPVHGKTVLDVGAWNGYFSVEAVRRGAKRVMALDKPSWEDPHFQGLQGFELVKQYLAPNIEAVTRDVMDLRHNPVGNFDVVLFLGVLYHLKHPLYVLETLFHLTLEYLVVETHLDLVDYSRPAMVFYPGKEQGEDPTNWWGPNPQCVIDMLKTVGFSRVEFTFTPFTLDTRGFFYAFK